MTNDLLDSHYKQRDGLQTEEVIGETLVLDESGGKVHQLNASASFIWNHCDGDHSVRDIVKQLAEHYEVDEAMVRQDVIAVIDRLRDHNLLDHQHGDAKRQNLE